ncbi:MAG TPA: transglycosylase SLT domain-containing protein, partial [Spirochaetota bacterium]|nr:transglycosylase SLT domain-containing protein [Spirochaetota bacterium]
IGLMQIIPATGDFISKKIKMSNYDLTDPADNIRMGTYYLQFLKNRYKEYPFILSSYNAGPGKTNTWKNLYKNFDNTTMYELIPIEETRHYIRKVMRSYYIYKHLYF